MDSIILLFLALIIIISFVAKSYKISYLLLAFVFFNGLFTLTGFLFPQLPTDKLVPIQLWINAILAFAFFLPNDVASFLKTL